MKTFLKTAIVLGLFSLAPLMNNVYAEDCIMTCITASNKCSNRCLGEHASDLTKRRACMDVCSNTRKTCMEGCDKK